MGQTSFSEAEYAGKRNPLHCGIVAVCHARSAFPQDGSGAARRLVLREPGE